MRGQDDNSLVLQILDGNSDAYRLIVDRHQRRIFYLGMKFFRKYEDAEDFAQEVFIRAFEKLHTFKGNVPFIAWLYRLAYNLAVNRYYLDKRRVIEVESIQQLDESVADSDVIPDNVILEKELHERVRSIIGELPNIYNILIKMHYFDGLTYKEISPILEMPVNTIKSYVMRAKRILNNKLKKYMNS